MTTGTSLQECDTATAALRLGWSRERIIRALLTQRLRGRRVVGRWLVDVGHLESVLREQCEEHAGPNAAD